MVRPFSAVNSPTLTLPGAPQSSILPLNTLYQFSIKKKISSHSEHSLLPLPSIFDVIIDFTNNIKDIDLLSLNFYPYLYLCSPDIFSQQHHCLSPLRNLDAHFVSISCLLQNIMSSIQSTFSCILSFFLSLMHTYMTAMHACTHTHCQGISTEDQTYSKQNLCYKNSPSLSHFSMPVLYNTLDTKSYIFMCFFLPSLLLIISSHHFSHYHSSAICPFFILTAPVSQQTLVASCNNTLKQPYHPYSSSLPTSLIFPPTYFD